MTIDRDDDRWCRCAYKGCWHQDEPAHPRWLDKSRPVGTGYWLVLQAACCRVRST